MSDSSSLSKDIASNQGSKQKLMGLFHLLVMYIVWGSTYLAIRVAVREGSGFPPFSMGATRLLLAGSLLLLGCALTRQKLKLSKYELTVLALTGILLWFGGNGLVTWAEQHTDSGYTALLVSTVPIWVAVIEALLDRKMPSKLLVLALLTGFAGIGLLTAPLLKYGTEFDLLSVPILIIGTVSWSAGMLYQSRRPVALNLFVSSGYQQIFGGMGFAIMSILLREPVPNPSTEAWLAWGYLLVFGSIFAFTSFLKAIRLLPANIVATYAYVNPVIAVFLGWFILHEPVGVWTIASMLLVLLGVAGVFRSQNLR